MLCLEDACARRQHRRRCGVPRAAVQEVHVTSQLCVCILRVRPQASLEASQKRVAQLEAEVQVGQPILQGITSVAVQTPNPW